MKGSLLLLAMAGGALGAGIRFLLGGLMLRQVGDHWPWGTLAANLLGSFLAGLVFSALEGRGASAVYWRALLIVGVMGGLTTWSALMLESLLYLRSGRESTLLAYFGTTLVAGLFLVWAGARLGQFLRP
jgi:CrcB protein